MTISLFSQFIHFGSCKKIIPLYTGTMVNDEIKENLKHLAAAKKKKAKSYRDYVEEAKKREGDPAYFRKHIKKGSEYITKW